MVELEEYELSSFRKKLHEERERAYSESERHENVRKIRELLNQKVI